MLRWLARCRDTRDEEWQRTTQQERSANTQSGRYLRGEEALQELFSVKIYFIFVYRPVVKVKAITWTSPPALQNVPRYAIKFNTDRDKFFCWGISKKPVCFSGKHKVANFNPYSNGWTTETAVDVLALINVPCQSSWSNDIKNDFSYPSSFLSCKYVRKGR